MSNSLINRVLLQKGFDNNVEDFSVELQKVGFDAEVIPYSAIDPYEEPEENPFFVYGSLEFAQHFNRGYPTYIDMLQLKEFECSNYYWCTPHLLNSDYFLLPFGGLKRNSELVFSVWEEFFVRPNSGYKYFTGYVVSRSNFDELKYTSLFNNELVLVSSRKTIGEEYRLVVGPEGLITGSQYNGRYEGCTYHNQVNEKHFHYETFKTIASEVITKFWPVPFFTIDVTEHEGEWKVVECNSFCCAGLYDCDLELIAQHLKRAFKRKADFDGMNIW